jgi:hypothetical protein
MKVSEIITMMLAKGAVQYSMCDWSDIFVSSFSFYFSDILIIDLVLDLLIYSGILFLFKYDKKTSSVHIVSQRF